MLGLLVRFEIAPEAFTHVLPGYRSLLAGDVLLEDNWAIILFQDQPIGYSHSTVDVNDHDPLRHFTLQNHVQVRLKAMGFDQTISVDTSAFVDAAHQLQGFAFELSSRAYRMAIQGRRREAERFDVSMKTAASEQHLVIEVPDDVIIYSPMTELALKRLRPGGELSFRTFDPATFAPSRMTVRAVREEPFIRDGVSVPAVVLESEYQGLTVHAWMGKDGTLLRQETPLGWTIQACSPEQAMAAMRNVGGGRSMAADLAVRVTGTVRAPRDTRQLTLRLVGADLDPARLTTNRQKAEPAGDRALTLVVRAARFPHTPTALDEVERRRYLEPSVYVQSAHPEIVAAAARVVAGAADDRARVAAIQEWVYTNVKKELTVSLPSALDVLHTMAGDCNEHTYLFTALARAAGIPAKIMVGLAYHEGSFYYHAWPAVYVGDWVEVDPTWGEATVDATHIRLAEGELDQQMDIIKVVGRLRIDVMEEL